MRSTPMSVANSEPTGGAGSGRWERSEHRPRRLPCSIGPAVARVARQTGQRARAAEQAECRRRGLGRFGKRHGIRCRSAALNARAIRARTPSGPLPPGSAAAGVEWPQLGPPALGTGRCAKRRRDRCAEVRRFPPSRPPTHQPDWTRTRIARRRHKRLTPLLGMKRLYKANPFLGHPTDLIH